MCQRAVAKNHRAMNCDSCEKWCHIKCGSVSPSQYTRFQLSNNICWQCPRCLSNISDQQIQLDATQPNDHAEVQNGAGENEVGILQSTFHPHEKDLKVAHINACSLLSSKILVEHCLEFSGLDILIVSETWLQDKIDDMIVHIDGYRIIRMDSKIKSKEKGGGLLVYYKEHLNLTKDTELSKTASDTCQIEQLWLKFSVGKSRPLMIAGVYRPPDSPIGDLNCLEESISAVISQGKDFVLLGDLNCDLKRTDYPQTKSLNAIIRSYHLKQTINEETRISQNSSSLIDLVISTDSLQLLKSGSIHNTISDHSLIYCIAPWKTPVPPTTYKIARSYRNFDIEKFKSDIKAANLDLTANTDDVNQAVVNWNKTYLEVLNKHAPLRAVKIKRQPKPWFNDTIQQAINHRNNLHKAAIATKDGETWERFKIEKKKMKQLVQKAKDKFFQDQLIEHKNDPTQLWTTIRRLLPKKKNIKSLPTSADKTSLAKDFNKYFAEIGENTQRRLEKTTRSFAFPDSLIVTKTKFSFKTVTSLEIEEIL